MTKLPTEKDRIYPVPYIIRSRVSLGWSILFLSAGLALLTLAAILFFSLRTETDNDPIIACMGAIEAVTAFIFLASWAYSGPLQKGFLRMDEEGISARTLWETKEALWGDIEDISVADIHGAKALHLIKRNGHITKILLSVPFALFNGTYFDRLAETVFFMTRQGAKQEPSSDDPIEKPASKNRRRGSGAALLYSFFLSLIPLAANLFISVLFPVHPGYLEIPASFLGAASLLTVYHRKAVPGPVRLLSRIFLGFFASFSLVNVPLATAIAGYPAADPFAVIAAEPVRYAPYFLAVAVLFFCGLSWDKVRRALRAVRGSFLPKRNGFTLHRSGKNYIIYLTDYADFDPSLPQEEFYFLPCSFLAEKAGKLPSAVYLPESLFVKKELISTPFSLTWIDGKNFYRLDLGECGEIAYLYHLCAMVCGKDRRIKAIRLIKYSL